MKQLIQLNDSQHPKSHIQTNRDGFPARNLGLAKIPSVTNPRKHSPSSYQASYTGNPVQSYESTGHRLATAKLPVNTIPPKAVLQSHEYLQMHQISGQKRPMKKFDPQPRHSMPTPHAPDSANPSRLTDPLLELGGFQLFPKHSAQKITSQRPTQDGQSQNRSNPQIPFRCLDGRARAKNSTGASNDPAESAKESSNQWKKDSSIPESQSSSSSARSRPLTPPWAVGRHFSNFVKSNITCGKPLVVCLLLVALWGLVTLLSLLGTSKDQERYDPSIPSILQTSHMSSLRSAASVDIHSQSLWVNHVVKGTDQLMIADTFESRWNAEVAPILQNRADQIWDRHTTTPLFCQPGERQIVAFSFAKSGAIPASVSLSRRCSNTRRARLCRYKRYVGDLRDLVVTLPSHSSRHTYSVQIVEDYLSLRPTDGGLPSPRRVKPLGTVSGPFFVELSDVSRLALQRYCGTSLRNFAADLLIEPLTVTNTRLLPLFELKRLFNLLKADSLEVADNGHSTWEKLQLSKATINPIDHSPHSLTFSHIHHLFNTDAQLAKNPFGHTSEISVSESISDTAPSNKQTDSYGSTVNFHQTPSTETVPFSDSVSQYDDTRDVKQEKNKDDSTYRPENLRGRSGHERRGKLRHDRWDNVDERGDRSFRDSYAERLEMIDELDRLRDKYYRKRGRLKRLEKHERDDGHERESDNYWLHDDKDEGRYKRGYDDIETLPERNYYKQKRKRGDRLPRHREDDFGGDGETSNNREPKSTLEWVRAILDDANLKNKTISENNVVARNSNATSPQNSTILSEITAAIRSSSSPKLQDTDVATPNANNHNPGMVEMNEKSILNTPTVTSGGLPLTQDGKFVNKSQLSSGPPGETELESKVQEGEEAAKAILSAKRREPILPNGENTEAKIRDTGNISASADMHSAADPPPTEPPDPLEGLIHRRSLPPPPPPPPPLLFPQHHSFGLPMRGQFAKTQQGSAFHGGFPAAHGQAYSFGRLSPAVAPEYGGMQSRISRSLGFHNREPHPFRGMNEAHGIRGMSGIGTMEMLDGQATYVTGPRTRINPEAAGTLSQYDGYRQPIPPTFSESSHPGTVGVRTPRMLGVVGHRSEMPSKEGIYVGREQEHFNDIGFMGQNMPRSGMSDMKMGTRMRAPSIARTQRGSFGMGYPKGTMGTS